MEEVKVFEYKNKLEWCPDYKGFSSYVLMLENGKMYKGYTSCFRKRMLQHFNNFGCRTTRISKPVYILHHEEYDTKQTAMAREQFFKSIQGFYWLKNPTSSLKTIKP